MPRLRRLRFSLRQGIILVTLACVACAGLNEYVQRRRVADHVRSVLEASNSRSLLVMTSTVGRKASDLVAYDDHSRLVAELFGVLNDPECRLPHRREVIRALRKLSDRPGVAGEMLKLLDAPPLADFRNTIFVELSWVKRDLALVVARLRELAHDPHDETRWGPARVLEQIAARHPEFSDVAAAPLVAGLRGNVQVASQRE
jgi:hypothetical protein